MRTKRHAFTLTELLVVIALLALLGGLLAIILPGFRERARAAKGGQALQGWLSYARQRALYEQGGRGVRFMISPVEDKNNNLTLDVGEDTNGNGVLDLFYVVRECQYIEKPADFVGDATHPLISNPSDPDPNFPTLTAGGFTFNDGSVETGDYLELLQTGQVYYVQVEETTSGSGNYNRLRLFRPLPSAITAQNTQVQITNYRIQRKARVTGDEVNKLPDGVIVDLSFYSPGHPNLGMYAVADQAYGNVLPQVTFEDPVAKTNPQYFDILFAPSGAVLDVGGATTILWVRTERGATLFADNPTLIVTYVNSGAVSAYDPVPAGAGGNPYGKVR